MLCISAMLNARFDSAELTLRKAVDHWPLDAAADASVVECLLTGDLPQRQFRTVGESPKFEQARFVRVQRQAELP